MVVRKIIPSTAALAVVLAHRAPLALADVRPQRCQGMPRRICSRRAASAAQGVAACSPAYTELTIGSALPGREKSGLTAFIPPGVGGCRIEQVKEQRRSCPVALFGQSIDRVSQARQVICCVIPFRSRVGKQGFGCGD
jgi:hypothetical protein